MKSNKNLKLDFPKIKPMRNLSLVFLTMGIWLITTSAFTQTQDKKWNVGVLGGISVYAGDLGNSMTDFTSDVFNQNLHGGINLSRYLGRSFDLALNTNVGSFGYYESGNTIFKGYMVHGNLNLKYKLNNGYMLQENSLLAPYLFVGGGASNFTGKNITNGFDYPIVGGLGFRLRLTPSVNIVYQTTFGMMTNAHNNPEAIPFTKPTGQDQFMLHMLGVSFNLGRGNDIDKDGVSDSKDKCPETPPNVKVDQDGCPIDTDKDGVYDYQDKCLDVAGTMNTNGCPDSDNDGIINSEDLCPNEAGLAGTNGCPDSDQDGIKDGDDFCPNVKGLPQFKGCPDTDKDGIEDSKDMCPNEAGLASANGCPDTDNDGVQDNIDKCKTLAGSAEHFGCPDTDKDGIFDDIDQCRTIPGVPANNGCPEVKKDVKMLFQKALQGIQFETGKATIKPSSFAILNSIKNVMIENPSYKLIIGGHTDNVGEDAMNMTLSTERAASVSNYLITNGINPMRLSSEGFGETKPIDTNKSASGRTQNRRVELSVQFMEVVN